MAFLSGTVWDFFPGQDEGMDFNLDEDRPAAPIFVDRMIFFAYDAQGDRCFITDVRNDRPIFDVLGDSDLTARIIDFGGQAVYGLRIEEIGGNGRLQVHVA